MNARKNTRINIQNKIVTIKLAYSTYPYRSAKNKKEKGRKKANFLSYVRKKKNANLHKRYAVQFITFHTRALPRFDIL